MKKLLSSGLLLTAFLSFLAAQQKEEGVAYCFTGEDIAGFYATHKTYPFGTELIVSNPVNDTRITVQVGGRPNPALPKVLVEISPEAAEKLGMFNDIPTWVHVQEVPKAATAPALRPRIGAVKQTGNALALATGTEMTGSHPSIPMGTRVKLTNYITGKDITIVIRGRISASRERIVEISQAAAQALGIRRSGEVRLETLKN